MSTLVRVSRILPIVVLAGLGVTAVGVPTSQGADPFVAGGRSTRAVDLPVSQADRAIARGRQLAAALGLPGVSQRAQRLDDRFEHRTYDEVTSLDATGHEVAIARFEADGTVAMALVLGWHPGPASAVDRTAAEARGLALVRAAGIVVGSRPTVVASAGSGGWSIGWTRVVDGVPVRGDGVRIALWPDGSFHGLSRMQRPLAAQPSQPIAADAARASAEAWIAGRFGPAAADVGVVAVDRAWVAPNDTFIANGLDAPAATLRLAWVVRFDTHGPRAERLRSVEVWIDAGDGSLLGGDMVE
ncbi:MAG TPA: hypothetical protein VIM20_01350 [Candidatus Limnocylindrales bacterium]